MAVTRRIRRMKAYSRASMAAGRWSEPGQGPVRPLGQRQSRLRSIRSSWPGTLCADLTVLIRGSVSSELFGGGSSGVGCAAPETGEQLEILVFILRADLLHRRVHPRVNDVETEHLRTLAARRPDDDTAALRGVAAAVDPAAAFEPVEDAGHGGGCSPRAPIGLGRRHLRRCAVRHRDHRVAARSVRAGPRGAARPGRRPASLSASCAPADGWSPPPFRCRRSPCTVKLSSPLPRRSPAGSARGLRQGPPRRSPGSGPHRARGPGPPHSAVRAGYLESRWSRRSACRCRTPFSPFS